MYQYGPNASMNDPEFLGMGLNPQDFDFGHVGKNDIRLLGKLDLMQFPPEGVPVNLDDSNAHVERKQTMADYTDWKEEEKYSPYTGDRNERGEKEGKGKIIWDNGSEYNGQWVANKRSGNGIFIGADGSKYIGQWYQDMKHGRGKFMFPDGSFLFGTWQNDRLNGMAKYKKKGQRDFEFVIYKEDMLIKSSAGGIKCEDWCYLVFAVLLMLGAISISLLYYVIEQSDLYQDDSSIWYFAGCYIFYMCYSCGTSSTRYLQNCTDIDMVFTNLDLAIRSPPVMVFEIQCYHYEKIKETETDEYGNTRTVSTRTERFDTHFAREYFQITVWQDQSPPTSVLNYLGVMKLARLRTYKTIKFSPQGRRSFEF